MIHGKVPNEEVSAFFKLYLVEWVSIEVTTIIAPFYKKLAEEGYDITASHPRKTWYIA